MEDKKTEQYTFASDEKGILEILASFENELKEKLQEEKSEVQRIKYYEKFQMNGIDFNNIFITAEKDIDGNVIYYVYSGSPLNEILSIDSEGNIKMIPELEAYLGEIDLDEIMQENDKEKDRLKGISEKIEPEEMYKILEGKKEEEPKEQQEDEENEVEKQEIEEDLQEQGEDLKISSYRKIKDPYISEKIPEAFGKIQENGIAFSNKLNRFVIISKVGGRYHINENVEPSQTTWKSVISIDENGERIEKKVPHSLMQIQGNDEKEISVTIGQYGEIDIETVDVLPCDERIARSVRLQGEGQEKEESYQVRNEFETQGKEYGHELAHKANKVLEQQAEDTEKQVHEITAKDYIPNTKMTWGQLMDKTGEPLLTLVERYNREMERKGIDSKKAVEIIEQDYENILHNRNMI